jgi:soluble cytochrome b562
VSEFYIAKWSCAVVPKEGLYIYHGRLIRFLKGISRRLQLLTALEFLLLLASYVILILLGGYFVPGLKKPLPYLPFIFAASAILFFFVLLGLGLWRILLNPSLERLATGVETKFPRFRDDVTNALSLFHEVEEGKNAGQISEGLIIAHLRRTAEKVSTLHPRQVINLKRGLRHLRLFLPLVAVFSIVFAVDPSFLNRSLAYILHPFSSLPVSDTFISVEPGDSTVLRGTPLSITAKATGDIPERLVLVMWPEDGEPSRLPMEPGAEGRFTARLVAVQSSFRFQAVSSRGTSSVVNIRVVDAPEVEAIRLTLLPPGYTRLPKEVKQDGHIEALKGTVVNLEARTNKPVKEGKIVLSQGNQLALQVKGDRLTGSLDVFHPGTYSIRVKDELDFENSNPVQYRIQIIPDKDPVGEILGPAEDLEVSGTEIIPVVYAARDDFGVTALRLSYQMGGTERFITLQNSSLGRSFGPETFRWDLTGLALTPGDRVAYRLEAWDNDTLSGPKAGYSRTFLLYVRDERDRVAKEAEEAQKIADALMDLLADQLEETKDPEALSRDMDKILEQVNQNLQKMGEEKVQHFDLEALKRNLTSLQKRMAEEPKETVTREMERLALLAEDIAKKAKMNEMEALAREIRNRQRRLIDALRDQKGPLTPEALQAMLQEIDKLRQLLNTVMDALSKMAAQLPDEFINSPELSGLEFQDLFKDLDEIQKQLLEGNIEAALEAAQRLLQQLAEMMAAMARAGSQASTGSFDRLQSEMSRQAGELDKIIAEQQEILSRTEGMDREMKRLAEEESRKRLDQSLPQLQETMERLKGSLRSEQRDSIQELEKLLKDGRLEQFSKLARDLEKGLSNRPEARHLMEQLMKQAEGLLPEAGEVMTPDQHERFPRLSSRQETLEGRTKSLAEKLEMLSQLFPGMDTEILNDLKDAGDSMGQAAGKLQGEDAPGAIPPEQQALRSLSKSQQAMQQMSQQMAMRMQANRWGYPLAYDPRPGWYYGPWVPMPTLPQPEVRRPKEKGYTGIDREEFEPPSKDAYKAPQILREKVMESLKEGIPSQYRREVERYFRGLTE